MCSFVCDSEWLPDAYRSNKWSNATGTRKQPVEYVMEYTNVFSIGQAVLAMSEESAPEIVCVHLFVTEWLPDVHRSSK